MSPSTADDASAVAMAEHLLALVKERSASHSSSTEFYNKSIEVQATCESLLRVVMGPLQYTALVAESCQESQALYFATQFGIADLIGDGALSLVEIGEKTGVETQFLGVVMNCLSGLGYFEFEEDASGAGRYRNNALSAVLREEHPNSMKSAIGFVCDEGYNAASRLVDVAKRRGLGGTTADKRITGTNLAFNFDCSVFDWMAQPEQTWRGKRLGLAMKQLHGMANENVPLDYEWSALQSPIVDCGGGIGALEMAILKSESNRALAFTLFDIPETIENAKKAGSRCIYLNAQTASRNVSFAPGNFLAPTLAETGLPLGAPTYLIRHVLHDWTDAEVLRILRAVRAAMLAPPSSSSNYYPNGVKPEQKLLVCEMLVKPDSPRFVRTTSMQLLALNNGVTRTLGAMRALIEEAGFAVRKVHSMRAVDSIVEAVVRTD
ncbi:S-adenosyl-L-methionine-dependent methyltransferase [Mycena filopes]|nr:S-adenosyl-L-methionine-dependent methyltransferase [Mycena filopes]